MRTGIGADFFGPNLIPSFCSPWLESEMPRRCGACSNGYRNYMRLLVRLQKFRRVRCKGDVESILEEIRLEIHRQTGLFRGITEREFLSWLRRVIGEVLASKARYDSGEQCRNPRFERALIDELDRSSLA